MAWNWDEIETDWLGEARIALSQEEIVTGFEDVEHFLGRDWIEAKRVPGVTGVHPTLGIALLGPKLKRLEKVSNAEALIEKLRLNDPSAFAELEAIYILSSYFNDIEIQLGPETSVGEHLRRPDIRVRGGQEPWTYVEVTRPTESEAYTHVRTTMAQILGQIETVRKPFALEVYLRREPTSDEIQDLLRDITYLCERDGVIRQDLKEKLGFLLLNGDQPGQIVLQDHPGEEVRPRIGMARVIKGGDEPARHISVRMVFSDERAEEFIRREARQIPNDSAGIIMIQTSNAHNAFRSWGNLIERRFQPNLHTRVGLVCLFKGSSVGTAEGEAHRISTKVLQNPHAKFPVQTWIVDTLLSFQSD
jgi:hypothetical protein